MEPSLVVDKAGLDQKPAPKPKTSFLLGLIQNVLDVVLDAGGKEITILEKELPPTAVLPVESVTPSLDVPSELIKPESEWSEDVRRIAALTQRLGRNLLGVEVSVCFSLSSSLFEANMGRTESGSSFCFNYRKLGEQWFKQPNDSVEVLQLLIQEFGHYRSTHHYNPRYHEDLCLIGAKLATLVAKSPEVLR